MSWLKSVRANNCPDFAPEIIVCLRHRPLCRLLVQMSVSDERVFLNAICGHLYSHANCHYTITFVYNEQRSKTWQQSRLTGLAHVRTFTPAVPVAAIRAVLMTLATCIQRRSHTTLEYTQRRQSRDTGKFNEENINSFRAKKTQTGAHLRFLVVISRIPVCTAWLRIQSFRPTAGKLAKFYLSCIN